MAISMDRLRIALLTEYGLPVPAPRDGKPRHDQFPGDIKLPGGFETHRGDFHWEGYRVLVLTRTAARQRSPRAQVAHRILIHCDYCYQWHYAGKLIQHQKFCKRKYETTKTI